MPAESRRFNKPGRSRIRTSSVAPTSTATGRSVGWLMYPDASLISMTKELTSVCAASSSKALTLFLEPDAHAFR